MGTTLETVARNAAVDAVVDLLDGGVGDNGTLEILTSADAVLATFALPDPAFGAASNGIATANSITGVTASATGTAAKWQAKNKAGDVIIRGNAGATGSGASMTLSNVELTEDDPLNVTAWTYSQPASAA